MDSSQHAALIQRYIAAYNGFDIDGMIATLHEDVVFRNVSNGEVTHETRGVEAFRQQAAEGARMFTARKQMITDITPLIRDGDPGVLVTIDYHAALARGLPNGLKAGDTIELKGKSEFRFRDGRIVSIVDQS